ncbi:TetR/AcrR family transcriptional regulator [Pseudonocardiaceae bacterium YIM PH 21723]|nr:TetR/AcrR family transcriptional regulator [Pseudonocardiaceae bacterium YIM PH 21723]
MCRRTGCATRKSFSAARPPQGAPRRVGLATATQSEGSPVINRGRPRDASRDEALRTAAVEVMAEVGYRALTMDAVAARAKAGKATIYRRWESKLDLIIDTCSRLVNRNVPVPDTGSPAKDLRGILRDFSGFLQGPAGKAAQALVGELPHEPELATAFRATFLAHQRSVVLSILQRGVDSGEFDRSAPLELVAEQAAAAICYRLMLTGESLSDEWVDELVDRGLLPMLR